MTGDKKALDKVAALTFGDVQLRTRLQETTVLCMESILLGLLAKRGFNLVQARIQNKWIKSATFAGDTVDPFVLHAFPATGGSATNAAELLGERLATLKVRLAQLSFE